MLSLRLGLSLAGSQSAAPAAITVNTPPSFNTALLYIGQTIGAARVAGSYSSALGTPSEGTITYTVNGVSQAGSYVIQAGDTVVTSTVQLKLDGTPIAQYASTGSVAVPALVITTDTAPTFDPATLIVGNTVTFAYLAGGYSSTSGVVTEDTSNIQYYNSSDILVTGAHVIDASDGSFYGLVPLLLDGNPTGQYGIIAVFPVSNTAPIGGDVTSNLIVPAGPAVAPSAFIITDWTATDTMAGGTIEIDVDVLVADNGSALDQIAYSTNGGTTKTDIGWLLTDPIPSTYSITGLTDDVALNLTLWAHNAGGWSTTSDVKVRTPTTASATAPAAMSAPTLASTATRITTTLAAAPADGGSAITSYDLRWSNNGGSSWTTVTGITTGAVIAGFVPGATAQLVQTRAVNAIGAAAWSASGSIDMKVVTFIGWAANGIGTGATIVVDLTTLSAGTLAEGDLVISINSIDAVSDLNVGPTGWTEVLELYASASRRTDFGVDYKIMGVTPDTTCTMVGTSSAGRGGTGMCLVYRYVDPTTPLDVTTTSATGTGTDAADAPSITPVSAGALILALMGSSRPPSNGQLGTVPSGMTLLKALFGNGTSRGSWQMAAHKTDWASGAYDPAVATGTVGNASDSWAAGTLALRPY